MGINLPIDIWQLLHRVALARALKGGGRTSISALLVGPRSAASEGIGEGTRKLTGVSRLCGGSLNRAQIIVGMAFR